MSDDGRLDEMLRDVLGQRANAAGSCPGADTLEQYHLSTLGEARRSEVESHLLRCTDCDLAVDGMERFDAVVSDEAAMRARLDALAGEPRRWWQASWAAALAGAVAAVAVGAIVIPRWHEPAPPVRDQLVTWAARAQVVRLPQERSSAGPLVIQRTAGDKVIVLSLIVPMNPRLRYEATIENAHAVAVAAPVELAPETEGGEVHVAVDAAALPAGEYQLRVTEAGGVLERIPFTVARERVISR